MQHDTNVMFSLSTLDEAIGRNMNKVQLNRCKRNCNFYQFLVIITFFFLNLSLVSTRHVTEEHFTNVN